MECLDRLNQQVNKDKHLLQLEEAYLALRQLVSLDSHRMDNPNHSNNHPPPIPPNNKQLVYLVNLNLNNNNNNNNNNRQEVVYLELLLNRTLYSNKEVYLEQLATVPSPPTPLPKANQPLEDSLANHSQPMEEFYQ